VAGAPAPTPQKGDWNMTRYRFLAAALALAASSADAATIPVEPGLWEMTSTISMPMLPQPQVNTQTECIGKGQLSTDDVGGEDLDPACTLEASQVDDSTMRWTFECPVEGGGHSRGEWQATSHGDRVEGSGVMKMEMQGQAMEMTMRWEGRRIGDCP
jgi:hypothetical protein